jgi:hypothetical protein
MSNTGQRRHKRYEVHDVQGSLLFRTQVRVQNISVSGVAIETTERLKLGRVYSIRLSNSSDALDLSGTIRWCRLARTQVEKNGESVTVYEAGLAFDDVFTQKAVDLLRFLENHVILPLHQRVTGRFRVETLGTVDLESRYQFEVVKISLSGMLVKTHLDPVVGSAFVMELALRGGQIPINGRVAHVQRIAGQKGDESLSELGVEFVNVREDAHRALSEFITEELESPPPPA